jgi:hypothetical protein
MLVTSFYFSALARQTLVPELFSLCFFVSGVYDIAFWSSKSRLILEFLFFSWFENWSSSLGFPLLPVLAQSPYYAHIACFFICGRSNQASHG